MGAVAMDAVGDMLVLRFCRLRGLVRAVSDPPESGRPRIFYLTSLAHKESPEIPGGSAIFLRSVAMYRMHQIHKSLSI